MSGEKEFKKPRRVALFRSTKFGFTAIYELHGDNEDSYTPDDGWVRISEWLSVEFKPLSPEAVVGAELMALTKVRENVVREFSDKLAVIDGRMANLRSLPAPDYIASTVVHADEDAGCEGNP